MATIVWVNVWLIGDWIALAQEIIVNGSSGIYTEDQEGDSFFCDIDDESGCL